MAVKPKSSTQEPTPPAPTPVRAKTTSDGLDLMEWLQVNSRLVGGAAAVIAVVAAGYWFYLRSQQIKTINAEGIAILLVEQNVVQSLEVAQRAYILDNGRFVLEGSAADIASGPELKRAYLGM